MKLLNVDTIEQVKEKLSGYFSEYRPEKEWVPLYASMGRYLAEPIESDMDLPQFPRSVVDGYAVVSKDTFGVSESVPVFLEVVDAVEMGKTSSVCVKPGQAVYVPTGGMIPRGADGMVMVEFIEKLDDKTIAVYKPTTPGGGLMNRGDDFKQGQLLYSVGHHITRKDIGMLAAMGYVSVAVFRRPCVSIISTGDEIVDISKVPKPGQVRDINSHALSAFARDTGAWIEKIVIVKDDRRELMSTVYHALEQSDLVLLSGGSSAGIKDMTAQIIEELGHPGVITHGLAMKPGKPTIVGVVDQKLVVGLPGHPMAAILVYHVLVDAFIRKYFFKNEDSLLAITGEISENLHGGEGRETFQFVTLQQKGERTIASPIYAKSGSISQLMLADGYVRIAALAEGIPAGQAVRITMLNQ